MLQSNPQRKGLPLVANNSLTLLAWEIPGRTYLNQKLYTQLSHLSLMHESQTLIQIKIWPGLNGLAGISAACIIFT